MSKSFPNKYIVEMKKRDESLSRRIDRLECDIRKAKEMLKVP